MARDPEILTHLEWLGYLQPVGLVVSPPALVAAQAFPARWQWSSNPGPPEAPMVK